MAVELDRIALDDVGGNPERLARAIHEQLGDIPGPVPVLHIARALDIVEIRTEPLRSFEAALIATPDRGHGAILVNAHSPRSRQRYSIGHELGHYLNPWHVPTAPDGFQCTSEDMMTSSGNTRRLRQEAEANQFAIELLAPAARLASALSTSANLEAVITVSSELDISKAAAARRCVALHDERLAVVFSRNGKVIYAERGHEFPLLAVWKGDALPRLPVDPDGSLSSWMGVDSRDWLKGNNSGELSAQILQQANGYAITLLRLAPDNREAQEEAELDGLPAFRS